jgi:shikimate kinase
MTPPPRALILVGFMGAGKTSVGLTLSHQLGWRFQDLDARIEARERLSITELFREGEATFRRAEQAALAELLTEMSSSPTVAALGGGTFVQPDNLALIEQLSVPTVFLDAPVKELWSRCQSGDNSRPLMKSQNQFRQLYEARRALYMKAGLHVDTSGKDVNTIASAIASRLGLCHEPKE